MEPRPLAVEVVRQQEAAQPQLPVEVVRQREAAQPQLPVEVVRQREAAQPQLPAEVAHQRAVVVPVRPQLVEAAVVSPLRAVAIRKRVVAATRTEMPGIEEMSKSISVVLPLAGDTTGACGTGRGGTSGAGDGTSTALAVAGLKLRSASYGFAAEHQSFGQREARLPPFRNRGGKDSDALDSVKGAYHTEEGNVMNKVSLLAGIAIGAVLTAGVAQLQAQAPAPANTTRPAVFVVTEQTITDQDKYDKEYTAKARKVIADHGGRFIVRSNDVTMIEGDAPKRVIILGFKSVDEVKKWRASKDWMDLKPLRDQVMKARSFAVATCENPQGAKPGQTKC